MNSRLRVHCHSCQQYFLKSQGQKSLLSCANEISFPKLFCVCFSSMFLVSIVDRQMDFLCLCSLIHIGTSSTSVGLDHTCSSRLWFYSGMSFGTAAIFLLYFILFYCILLYCVLFLFLPMSRPDAFGRVYEPSQTQHEKFLGNNYTHPQTPFSPGICLTGASAAQGMQLAAAAGSLEQRGVLIANH